MGSTTDTPFTGVTISDVNLDNPTDTLTITLSDPNASLSLGAAQPAGVTFSNAGGGVYQLTGSAADVTSELDALVLTAPATLTGAVNGIEVLTFSLSDTTSAGPAAAATASVTANIYAPQPPTISGGSTTGALPASTADTPFAGVTIGDANPNNPVDTLTITMSDPNGSLSLGAAQPAGVAFESLGNGVYQLTGSAADVTSELDALTLNAPATLTGAVDGVEALTFSLSATSSSDPAAAATGSVTADISPAAPTLTGGSTTQADEGSTTDAPFAGVTIGDVNLTQPVETLTITLSDPNASLSLGAAQPQGVTFSNAGGGVYHLTGSAADVTSELDALTLNAPSTLTGAVNDVEALTFSLSDSSSADPSAVATDSVTADIIGPNAPKTFAYTGYVETFTVQTSGYYDIVAEGAQGGGGGGLGAMASGEIYLTAGATLEIVVGGAGQNGGGGGGSFVIETNNGSGAVDIDEVIAGGGGGGSNGGGGRTQPSGGNGGGIDGAAGPGAGGGGGGFTGGAAGQSGSVSGATFSGGSGGGGFGGGGAGGPANTGGGGGGFGGGGAGNSAGGGGSFVNGDAIAVAQTGATQSGDGLVTLTYTVPPPTIAGGSTTSADVGSTTDTPFAGVTVGDINPGATDTLTITLSDPNASLSLGAAQPAGVTFSNEGGGVYQLTGSAVDVTSELDALTLNAPASLTGAVNNVEALTFSLADKSSAGPAATATASVTADIVGPDHAKTFGYTGQIETFTAQTSGYYDIVAEGAQGGAGLVGGGAGGLGAMASGDIYLAAGATLEIVVGGAGWAGNGSGGGGGGGGSFVIETNDGTSAVDINEVIAGGGGGAETRGSGGGGVTAPTGAAGGAYQGGIYGAVAGAGGLDGAGGHAGAATYGVGGGGGGFTGGAAGQNGSVSGVSFAGGGDSGGFGGTSGAGGFGGGGGAQAYNGGGGGGGFGGGGGGGGSYGGGGGSFVNAEARDASQTAATWSGDGLVSITALYAPTISIASPAAHTTSGTKPVDPFAGDVITDPNLQTETLTVTPSTTANGALSDPNAATDGSSVDADTGVFTVSGTAEQVTAALDALVFTPIAHDASTITTFTISDLSSANPFPTLDSTTTVTDAPCYCPGSLILTDRGEVAVESLAIGDVVVTASGARRPIKWIGTRSYSARFARNNADAHPVCFKAGSLGEHVPHSDLWVSPKHAMFLEGVLIPAETLVNEMTIIQPLPKQDISYFHVELESHDVLLANGAPSESFLDDDSRGMFHNTVSYATMYPYEGRRSPVYCAPRVEDGYAFEQARRRLDARASLARNLNGQISKKVKAS